MTNIEDLERAVDTAATDLEKIQALNALAKEVRDNDPQRGKRLANDALQLIGEHQDYPHEKVTALRILGMCHRGISNYDTSLSHLKEALLLFKQVRDKQGIADSLNSIGNIYGNLADYPNALKYYQESLVIKQAISDKRGVAHSLNGIGLTLIKLHHYPEAETYLIDSLALSDELGLKRRRIEALDALSQLYAEIQQFEKAYLTHIDYHKTEKEVFNDESDKKFRNLQVVHQVENLKRDQEVSERVLLNVLPPVIAGRIKKGETTIADTFPDASVLFADIVGFTKLSATVSASALVKMLDGIFSKFDALTETHSLEKIKTIGDAYMVVGGLPEPRADHAEAIAQMATDMIAALEEFNREQNLSLDIRIGINSGEVVAGVIGKKKFTYDLWGDTVNTASRMESHGEAGRIHLSEATALRLQESFALEDRGEIEVKGKGLMHTFFLLRKK